jgi:hypothetical protein
MPSSRQRAKLYAMNTEQLTETLRRLVAERQTLRDSGASWAELERNRLEIVRRQQELSHAMIASHLHEPLQKAA